MDFRWHRSTPSPNWTPRVIMANTAEYVLEVKKFEALQVAPWTMPASPPPTCVGASEEAKSENSGEKNETLNDQTKSVSSLTTQALTDDMDEI